MLKRDKMKLFVWDFHGVLEKGNDEIVLEITNQALDIHGHKRRMTPEEGLLLSGNRWHDYFSYLLPELPTKEHFSLQTTCFNIQKTQPELFSKHLKLNDYADIVLDAIHNSIHHQILISNTPPDALDMFIETVGLSKYFPETHRFGVNSHYQKAITKTHCLDNYIEDKDFYETIISIGDSPGDMALIDQEKRQGIGYLYCHPNREHRPAKCHYKIHDLRLILQEITRQNAVNS